MGHPYKIFQTGYFTVVLAVYLALQLTDQPCEAEVLSTDSDEGTHMIAPRPETTIVVVDENAAAQIKFMRLVAEWKSETSITSSITEMVLHPSYQNIIGMGDTAVPLILSQIESEGDDPDQWFWALQSITGADPIPEEDAGN
jgi:hypothetical protein